MTDEHTTPWAADGAQRDASEDARRSRRRRLGWAGGLLAGGALAGALITAALPAAADNTGTAPAAATSAGPSEAAPGTARGNPPTRTDETLLTGADAEKATAAALKAVPGATVDRVETDADGAVYEAHLTRSDGSRVTVKFDKDFTVTAVEEGMGAMKGAPNGNR